MVEATITCPNCGQTARETMPANACVHFYECQSCGTLLRPKAGDCCVFCSYGSVRCPPHQVESALG
ncbi:MAG TPA: GDCCVxC domain-containing (seleno)protein [Gemmatimonadales bacterium]|nr:GDCCVxC domain-containing (seleno)protein [Gemmatimonadales bacterium]